MHAGCMSSSNRSDTTASPPPAPGGDSHLGLLDGLRGFLAFWVFFGHLQIACTGAAPTCGHPANAVDVFMILSGFLMTHHWVRRWEHFASGAHQTIDFYLRRFFRIAPLYYLLYTIAFFGAGWFSTAPKAGPRLMDALAHYSFVFGAIPAFVSNNVLPDWSIGLEMQFYLFFPLLLAAMVRWSPLASVFAGLVAAYVAKKMFGLYDGPPGPWGHFAQPGMLLFKVDVFLAGMCLALHWQQRAHLRCVMWLVLAACPLVTSPLEVKAAAIVMMLLLHFDAPRHDFVHRVLAGRVARFAGDVSYSVYLLHAILMHPILGWLMKQDWFTNLTAMARVSVALAIVGPPLYALSALLHRWVEQPGIALGRSVSAALSRRLGYPPAPLAAPAPSP